MKATVFLAVLMVIPLFSLAQSGEVNDVWEPIRFLIGSWEGTGEGMSGQSSVDADFEFVLNDQFLRAKSKSVFEPQEKNPDGEIHEDIGYISYDRSRETFVLRAFYVEGFVNTYLLSEISEDGMVLTFVTESVENAPAGTRAKLVYKMTGEGEIEERFFVAWPGKDYGCFLTNHLKRK
ncbi:MAG TPA: hypothetical protein ENO22_03005 [candidate division Zixibacteria bacterium]|nr:hypothetical protein [candidate division Zixibacteria bacterium]